MQLVRQPPSFLGTTPRPEQRVFGTGGVVYGPALHSCYHLRDDVWVCVCRGEIACNVLEVRAFVADETAVLYVVQELTNKVFVLGEMNASASYDSLVGEEGWSALGKFCRQVTEICFEADFCCAMTTLPASTTWSLERWSVNAGVGLAP